MADNILEILNGEKSSSVTFVMDYLQLDFDGNSFTINVWPSVNVFNKEYRFADHLYRDKLCSLISQVVSETTFKDKEYFIIQFANSDSISVSLDPDNPELIVPEIVEFTDVEGNWYVFD